MQKIATNDTKKIWQQPGWYRAFTLKERLASFKNDRKDEYEHSSSSCTKAEKRLEQWKAQAPYNKGVSFADRLAKERLTEDDLLILLAEADEALQARLTPPDWLPALRQAFEDSSDYPLPVQGEKDLAAAQVFLRVIRPLLNSAMQRLRDSISNLARRYTYIPFEQEKVILLLYSSLSQKIMAKTIRAFVLEMNVTRVLGHLRGNTSEERFVYFVEQLSVPEKSLAFLEEYAVLTRQCMLTIDHWVQFSIELLSRLCADWQELCATFSPDADPGLLSEMHIGAGDTHRGGRSVTALKFASGFQVVYKPRSLAIDLHVQEMLDWLNARGTHPPFQTLKSIDRGTYGWTAFVEARACQSEEEVRRFYERQGAYLALLYAFDGADLHAENIIAVGEYPLLIDLEVFFHPHIAEHTLFGQEPAFAALYHSVIRVGLLPQYIWGNQDARGIDVSGLGAGEGQVTPRAVPMWEGAGTDQMRLVRERVTMATSNNRPMLNGKPVDALAYQAYILSGFTGMYQTLFQHRDALLAEMLPRFAQDEIRFVARPTDIYARLLYDSFRPELLRDALERERHFDRLWVGIDWQPHMARLISAERDDLLQGDIPLFTARPASRDLFTSTGEAIPALFEQTSMERVKKRLQSLNEQDCARQLWIINASFTCATVHTQGTVYGEYAIDDRHICQSAHEMAGHSPYLHTARKIGDVLCQQAEHEKDVAGWLGIYQLQEHTCEVRAAGLDLYNGLPGIALFLAYLAEMTGGSCYRELARAALQNIQTLLQHPQRQRLLSCIGAFEGWGGLLYLFTQLGMLWNEPALLQTAEELVPLLRDGIGRDEAFDIVAGSAGGIVALLTLYAVRPSSHILDAAIACGDHLLAHVHAQAVGIGWLPHQLEVPLTGMAHGNAGIACSLLRLAEQSGEERFRQVADAALAYERHLFSPTHRNWPDLRKHKGSTQSDRTAAHENQEQRERFMTAWCHGAPGIALARLASLYTLEDTTMYEEIVHALATTLAASENSSPDPTLCHGTAGLLETLLTVRQVLAYDDITPQIERLAKRLQMQVTGRLSQAESGTSAWWTRCPGLMQGLVGIGYTFLRLVDPQRVPALLTLAEPIISEHEDGKVRKLQVSNVQRVNNS